MADHKRESTYCCGQEHSKQVSETCCSHKDSHIHPDHDHDHSSCSCGNEKPGAFSGVMVVVVPAGTAVFGAAF